jgi:branched-chain amino acid transport system permease protein
MEVAIYGVINSLTLVLMALGFAIAYSVSRVPNFAHGALYVLAGYMCWLLLRTAGLGYIPSIIVSIAITAIVGGLIYRLVLIRVRGMPVSEIIGSFTIGIAILELMRWSGLRGGTLLLPPFATGVVEIFGVPVDLQRIIIIAIAALMLLTVWLFTHYTRVGLSFRAIAQDERAALMLGIDSDRAAALALLFGSALAAVAAITLFPLSVVQVDTGYDVLILALAVCICGGLGSWTGTVVAGFVLGFAQTIVGYYINPLYQMVVVMVAIILILIFRPSGFFGTQKELEERV